MMTTTIVSRVLLGAWSGIKLFFGVLSGFTVLSQLVPDFKLAYAMIVVYTTLVSHISSTAAIEAERDVASGKNFTINANWTNEQISGGISDPVLWGCRRYSDTIRYYRVLYGVLLCSYLIALTVYILIKFVDSWLGFNGYIELKRDLVKEHIDKDVVIGYLLNVAQRLKLILSLEYRLENLDNVLTDVPDQWVEKENTTKKSNMCMGVLCVLFHSHVGYSADPGIHHSNNFVI